MKKIIRRLIQSIYFYAFPKTERKLNCILGEGSQVDDRAVVVNSSPNKANITIGTHSYIAGHLTVWENAGKIEIGDFSFIGEGTQLFSAKSIRIGNRVQIAHGCNIFDSNVHSLDPVRRNEEYIQNISKGLVKLYDVKEKEVVIEDDAWLGAAVIVLKGVTIGKGAIIGAGSVVTKNIPSYATAVGNPARVVKTSE